MVSGWAFRSALFLVYVLNHVLIVCSAYVNYSWPVITIPFWWAPFSRTSSSDEAQSSLHEDMLMPFLICIQRLDVWKLLIFSLKWNSPHNTWRSGVLLFLFLFFSLLLVLCLNSLVLSPVIWQLSISACNRACYLFLTIGTTLRMGIVMRWAVFSLLYSFTPFKYFSMVVYAHWNPGSEVR